MDNPGKQTHATPTVVDRLAEINPVLAEEMRAGMALVPEVWLDSILFARVVDGKLACLRRYLYTTGLHTYVMLDNTGIDYEARYCYEHFHDALDALLTYSGHGDPLGPWIKEKVRNRLGPGILHD